MGLLLTLNPPGFSKTCLGLFLFGATKTRTILVRTNNKNWIFSQIPIVQRLKLYYNSPTTDKGVADEFELEAGDETLDLLLTSLVSFGTLSFFEGPCD